MGIYVYGKQKNYIWELHPANMYKILGPLWINPITVFTFCGKARLVIYTDIFCWDTFQAYVYKLVP